MKYTIEVEETLSKTIEIDAKSESEALEKANKQYKNADIILSGDDYVGHEIRVLHTHRKNMIY